MSSKKLTDKQILENSILEEKTTKVDYVSFWKPGGIYGQFSQWYPAKIIDGKGIEYANCEQYMMYHKAMLFGDSVTANKILRETKPSTVKSLGRQVKNFNEKKWIENRESIAYDGNYLKFKQHDKLKKLILSCKGKKFVEASPYDNVWGIGYDTNNAPANYRNWGLNLLGKTLDKVLETLLEESEILN